MYNEEVKQEYIDTITNAGTKKYAKQVFNGLGERSEYPLDKDIATMNRDELISAIESMGYLNVKAARSVLSFLRNYIPWYDKSISPIDLSQIEDLYVKDIDFSYAIKQSLFENEEELTHSLLKVSAKEGYFEVPVLYLAWLGLDLDEILSLKNEDVYSKSGSVFVETKNRTIQVKSPVISEALVDYGRVKQSTRQHRGTWNVYADDLGYYIKNMLQAGSKIEGREVDPAAVRNKIGKYNYFLPSDAKNVLFENVLDSGRYWRLREEERQHGEIQADVIINEFKLKRKAPISDIQRMYGFYKKAFGE